MLNILGADLITIYIYQAGDNFVKAVDYYQKLGRMKSFNMSVPGQLMPFPGFVYTTEKHVEALVLELAAYHDLSKFSKM